MSNRDDAQMFGLVKDLAKAVSVQAKVANKIWLVLITFALLALLPRVPDSSGKIKLPLQLGDADPATFYSVLFGMLVVLTIGFAAAHAQQMRSAKLAQQRIDSLIAEKPAIHGVDPRDLFDMMRLPGLNRVASLPQLLIPKVQPCPIWILWISRAFYLALKLVSQVVYFGLPGIALWSTYNRLEPTYFWFMFLQVAGVIAASTLILITTVDLHYLIYITSFIGQGSGHPAKKPRS